MCSDLGPPARLLAAETVEPALRPIVRDRGWTLKRRRGPVGIVAQVGEGAAVPFVSRSAIVGDRDDLRFRGGFGARFVVTRYDNRRIGGMGRHRAPRRVNSPSKYRCPTESVEDASAANHGSSDPIYGRALERTVGSVRSMRRCIVRG